MEVISALRMPNGTGINCLKSSLPLGGPDIVLLGTWDFLVSYSSRPNKQTRTKYKSVKENERYNNMMKNINSKNTMFLLIFNS